MKSFVGPFPMDTKPVRDGVFGCVLKYNQFDRVAYRLGYIAFYGGTFGTAMPSLEAAEHYKGEPERFADELSGWFGIEQ